VEHGAAESEALLPAARKLRRKTIEIGAEAIELDDFVHALTKALGREAVDAAVKRKVFGDGQVAVQAEILRHVTDVFADAFRIGVDIDALHGGFARGEWKQSSEHFDHCGFAAAVGAEEAEDFTFRDVEADVIHSGECAETPHEVVGGNRELVRGGHRSRVRVEFHIRGHAGEDTMGRIVDADFHTENLVNAFFAGLHVARQKFGLLIDLFHHTLKDLVRK
jgi:hypothetical protein